MEPEIQLKIQETVLHILRKADMNEMTEFKVRAAASERLGIDLSDIHCKRFIRGLVESFLLSTLEVGAEEGKEAGSSNGGREDTPEMAREGQQEIPRKEFDSEGNRVICKVRTLISCCLSPFFSNIFFCSNHMDRLITIGILIFSIGNYNSNMK